jgi:hypothetical protein
MGIARPRCTKSLIKHPLPPPHKCPASRDGHEPLGTRRHEGTRLGRTPRRQTAVEDGTEEGGQWSPESSVMAENEPLDREHAFGEIARASLLSRGIGNGGQARMLCRHAFIVRFRRGMRKWHD